MKQNQQESRYGVLKDKMHLEKCPSRRIGKVSTVKVDISPKLDVIELEANGNVLKPDVSLTLRTKRKRRYRPPNPFKLGGH